MATASITLSGTVNALGFGSLAVGPANIELSAAIGSREIRTLSSGATIIDLPSGTSCVFIRPPAGNTVSLTIMGDDGDVGLRLHNTEWSIISVHSTTAALILSAASTITGVELVYL